MAQTAPLPISEVSYDLCLQAEQTVAKRGRAHRHGLGGGDRETERGVVTVGAE
jgi:hypothetical protein